MLARAQQRASRSAEAVAGWEDRVAAAASLASVRRAANQAARDQQWLNRQHVAICQIPAPTFREADRAEHLRGVFNGLGHPAKIDPAGNVVVPIVHSKRLPFLAVTAHMDTILAPSRPEDIRVDPGGVMRGPGVTDNGTGLTALVALAKLLAAPLVDSPSRNLLLVANVAEEGEGNLHGMRYLAEHSPYAEAIDRYVIIDGASMTHITAAGLGSARYEVSIEGQGGHSWNDFGRANPVSALATAVSLMTQARLPAQPRTTLSVGVIQGGTSVNSIPCAARAKVDIRSADQRGIARAAKAVEDAGRMAVRAENRRSTDRLTGFHIREIGNRPAADLLERNPVAECFQAVDRHLAIPSRLDCASTDANVPLAAGIPAVAVGSGGRGANAHAPDEWYDPAGRDFGIRRLVLALASLLSRP